jgi:tetratricopeptide (TPR) repeat protein
MHRTTLIAVLASCPLLAADDPRLEYALGVHAGIQGREDAAAEHFERARLAGPDAAPLVRIGAERMLGDGDRAGAVKLYQDLADARPDDLAVQLAFVDFIIGLDREDAVVHKLAGECLEAALGKHPGNPEIIRRLVSLRLIRKETRAALDLMELLPVDDPTAARWFVSEYRKLHEKDDLQARAVIDRRYQMALDAHPEDAALAREISDHYRNTDRPEDAVEVLRKHAAAAPWSLELRVRLGVLLFSAKKDDEGEAVLKEVLAIHPGRAMAHQALAKFYRTRERSGQAAHHAREVLKIRGGDAAEFIRLADERLAAGDPREARLLLERAVYQQPGHLGLAMKLAIATYRDPETRVRGPRLFREAEAAAPDGKITDPGFLSESAGAMIDSGQSRAAEERLRAAIRAYPAEAKKETAAALRRLAALWNAENRNADAARALIQRAGILDPTADF